MSTTKGVRDGFRAIARGFSLMAKHRRLMWYGVIPLVIQLILLAALLVYLYHHTGTLSGWVHYFLPDAAATHPGFWGKVLGGIVWMIYQLIYLVLLVLGLLTACFATFLVGMVVAAPFNDLLSEWTEVILTGRPAPVFTWRQLVHGIIRSMLVELKKTGFLLAVPVVLLVLHLIPIVGSLVYLLGSTLFGIWATGMLFLDYPLGRRYLSFRERLRFAWRHRKAAMGLGVVFCIPGFLFFFSAPLVVAGTALYCKIAKEKQ